jgi:hypothetical protein
MTSPYCDHQEILVSAWLDGELERREATEMLDHLVRCENCRSFYREARAVDGLAQGLGAAPGEPVPEHLWDGIVEATRPRRRASSVGTWALRVAALLVVALGLAVAVAPPSLAPAERESAALALAAGSEEMTEERFLLLAIEVLEADARYQRAMYRAIGELLETSPPTEGGREERRRAGERGEGGERSERVGGQA